MWFLEMYQQLIEKKNGMNVPESWMLKGSGSFKTLIAEKIYPLEGNGGS